MQDFVGKMIAVRAPAPSRSVRHCVSTGRWWSSSFCENWGCEASAIWSVGDFCRVLCPPLGKAFPTRGKPFRWCSLSVAVPQYPHRIEPYSESVTLWTFRLIRVAYVRCVSLARKCRLFDCTNFQVNNGVLYFLDYVEDIYIRVLTDLVSIHPPIICIYHYY